MAQHATLLGYIYIVHKCVFQKLKVLTQRKEVNERNSNRYEGKSEDTVAAGAAFELHGSLAWRKWTGAYSSIPCSLLQRWAR